MVILTRGRKEDRKHRTHKGTNAGTGADRDPGGSRHRRKQAIDREATTPTWQWPEHSGLDMYRPISQGEDTQPQTDEKSANGQPEG